MQLAAPLLNSCPRKGRRVLDRCTHERVCLSRPISSSHGLSRPFSPTPHKQSALRPPVRLLSSWQHTIRGAMAVRIPHKNLLSLRADPLSNPSCNHGWWGAPPLVYTTSILPPDPPHNPKTVSHSLQDLQQPGTDPTI